MLVRVIRLREAVLITVQAATTSENDLGEAENVWADVGTVLGEIQPLTAAEQADIAGRIPTATHRLFTTGEVTRGNRLVSGSKTYLVCIPEDWGTHREVILQEVF